MEKRILKLSFVLAILIGFSSCAKQNNPPSKVEDPNAESERIYGDIDGPPRQSLLEYTADPSHIARADAIRQKLFPK
jgi:hypothetical protein